MRINKNESWIRALYASHRKIRTDEYYLILSEVEQQTRTDDQSYEDHAIP